MANYRPVSQAPPIPPPEAVATSHQQPYYSTTTRNYQQPQPQLQQLPPPPPYQPQQLQSQQLQPQQLQLQQLQQQQLQLQQLQPHQSFSNYPSAPTQQSPAPPAPDFQRSTPSVERTPSPFSPWPSTGTAVPASYYNQQYHHHQSAPTQHLYQTAPPNLPVSQPVISLPTGYQYGQPLSYGSNPVPAVTSQPNPPPSTWQSYQHYSVPQSQHQPYNPALMRQHSPLPSQPYTVEPYNAQVQQNFTPQHHSPALFQGNAVGGYGAPSLAQIPPGPKFMDPSHRLSVPSTYSGSYMNAPPSPKPAGLKSMVYSKVQGYLSKIAQPPPHVPLSTQFSNSASLNTQGMANIPDNFNTSLSPAIPPESHFSQANQLPSEPQYGPVPIPLPYLLPNPAKGDERLPASTEMQPLPVTQPYQAITPSPTVESSIGTSDVKVDLIENPGGTISPATPATAEIDHQQTVQASTKHLNIGPGPIPFVSNATTGLADNEEAHHMYVEPLPQSPPPAALPTQPTGDSTISNSSGLNQPMTESPTHSSFTAPAAVQPGSDMLNRTQPIPPPTSLPTSTSPRAAPPAQKKKGFLSSVISQLEQLQIAGHPPESTHNSQYDSWDDDEPRAFMTPMRAEGNPVSRRCNSEYELEYETSWYYLTDTPDFLICTFCHENYISGSPFASSFQSIRKKPGRCRFKVPRVTQSLWPSVCRTGDLSPLSDYIARRVNIPTCKGIGGAVMADKIKWFIDLDREIEGFIACEACYEGIILGTDFASHFCESSRTQGPNEKWSCDLCLDYIQRAMKKISKSGNVNSRWAEFVRAAAQRMALPKCEGKAVRTSSIKWYRPREVVENLVFCEACFMDYLAMTPYAREFEEVVVDSKDKYKSWMCDLKPMNMAEAVCRNLQKRSDFSVFRLAAVAIMASPRCFTVEGISGGKWYNFKTEVSNFGICEGCYAGIIVPNDLTQFLSSQPHGNGPKTALYCTFNSNGSRFPEFIRQFCEAVDTGVWALYEDYVRKWAPIFQCVRTEMVSNRAWYGWPDCGICQECYEMAVCGTTLADSMPLQNTYLEEQKVCCMYSPRMREKYTAACTAGDVEDLLTFSRERMAVYQQTIPTITAIRQKRKMEMDVANANMQMSASHTASDTMNSVFGTGGYYSNGLSWERVASQQAWDKAMAGMKRANDPTLIAEIDRLEAIWKQVE